MPIALPPSRFSTPAQVWLFVASVAVTYLVGYASTLVTGRANLRPAWYEMNKPRFAPPPTVFSVAWGVLFMLLSISLFLTLRRHGRVPAGAFRWLVALYAWNLALIFCWTPTFFKLRKVGLALAEIAAMIAVVITITVLQLRLRPVCPGAIIPLAPYGMWLLFAAALTAHFVGRQVART